ncbi:MAG: hypothetical protein AB7F61_12960 [Desulfobulbus sp.]
MKKIVFYIAVVFFLFHIAGCSSVKSMWSDEKDMNSVHHWNTLANHVANRMNNELVRKKMFNTTVYIRHSCGAPNKCGPSETYPFDEGFHDLLISQLVNFGVHAVSAPESGDLVMEYKVQAVFHPPEQSSWNWFAADGYYEILISAYIIDKNKYFFLFSDIYTIPQNEFWQYRQSFPASDIKLTGPTTVPHPPAASKKTTSL